MPTKLDKVILTNLSALKKKYGDAGLAKIKAAVQQLIAADQRRGLAASLIAIDDAATMSGFHGRPVLTATNRRQNKDAVDAVYKSLAPDYILILGSIDVIPHQNLNNPMYASGQADSDPDRYAFGDLPYACEAPYSSRPDKFFGPTRVVGRLPDVTGGTDPSYLVKLLKTASSYTQRDPAVYHDYFGISAEIWKGSSQMSVTNIFGAASQLRTIPPSGSSWPGTVLSKRSQFINCHGAESSTQFYGQPASGASQYPVALDAAQVNGKIKEGTIVSAECCYGGELFDPAATKGQPGMCNTYLANKSYGFFASTTIAYGPATSNDQADLICQYFLKSVLRGASLGRAALEARQEFIHSASMSDPSNVKTIAQFNLYGDPSLTPIAAATPHGVSPTKAMVTDYRVHRSERRRDLFRRGVTLGVSQPLIRKAKARKPFLSQLAQSARKNRMRPSTVLTYMVKHPSQSPSMPKAMIARELLPTRVHIVFGNGRAEVQKGSRMKRKSTNPRGPVQIEVLVVKEIDGKIVSSMKCHSR